MGKKILLIEDNKGDQALIIDMINQMDPSCGVAAVSSGEQGVASVAASKPDILITDTNLPGMDGFETCRKVREICGDSVKIIVMTGEIDAVDAGKARKAGADDYCVKTTDYLDLVEALKNLG